MKIQCPKCRQVVPADQVNMASDLAFCPQCNDGFKISSSMDQDAVSADVLEHPPKGAWFRQEVDQVIIGASTRSPMAFILVPFMCVWSGGSLGGIYGSQITQGEFDLGQSLFGIPFLIGTLVLGTFALMTVCGKVQVSIGQRSSVFVGIGALGWKRWFDWASVRSVREEQTTSQHTDSNRHALVIEGDTRLKFGSGLNEARRYFVLNALKYLKAQTR